MCNKCGHLTCNCYQSVPNYPTFTPCPPVMSCGQAPPPCPVTGLNLLYTGLATINLEFFNMPGVTKTLIPAPGPGKLIVPIQMWNFLKFGSTPYQDNALNIPTLLMNLGTQNIITDLTILGAGADQTSHYQLPGYTIPGSLINQPLTITTISQPIVGDSVIYSYIVYTIVNL